MHSPIRHLHIRKRRQSIHDPYPHPNRWINALDKLVLVVGILGPVMTLPQILKIFVDKNASGVSAITWLLFAVFDIPWIVYGFVHKEKPILISYILWFTTNTIVVIGTLMYQ
jgi:uncharacterized protein with PQ loop repeat